MTHQGKINNIDLKSCIYDLYCSADCMIKKLLHKYNNPNNYSIHQCHMLNNQSYKVYIFWYPSLHSREQGNLVDINQYYFDPNTVKDISGNR